MPHTPLLMSLNLLIWPWNVQFLLWESSHVSSCKLPLYFSNVSKPVIYVQLWYWSTFKLKSITILCSVCSLPELSSWKDKPQTTKKTLLCVSYRYDTTVTTHTHIFYYIQLKNSFMEIWRSIYSKDLQGEMFFLSQWCME